VSVASIEIHNQYFRFKNRLLDVFSPRKIGTRIETAPFLSSDSYAIKIQNSKHILEDESQLDSFLQFGQLPSTLYVPSRLAKKTSKALTEKGLGIRRLVLGDDDFIFQRNALEEMFPSVEKIYSVNVVINSKKVVGIPLGLESPSYRSGGRLKDFLKVPSNNPKSRNYSFLASWNNSTFPKSRSEAFKVYEVDKQSFASEARISPQTFHYLARKALYVVCPRGNGLDTHRVWEALYLGAVPIVKRSEYFSALEGWPIWVVDTWGEPCGYSRVDLEDLYSSFDVTRKTLIDLSQAVVEKILHD